MKKEKGEKRSENRDALSEKGGNRDALSEKRDNRDKHALTMTVTRDDATTTLIITLCHACVRKYVCT